MDEEAYTIDGNSIMPNHAGTGSMTGNSGHGYAKITAQEVIIDEEQEFEYSGVVKPITLSPGRYKLQVWGADGGSTAWKTGGKGGYSEGILTLSASTPINIYVGEKGKTSSNVAIPSSFGGGGSLAAQTNTTYYENGASGGGASDVRINSTALDKRVIVAGGRTVEPILMETDQFLMLVMVVTVED